MLQEKPKTEKQLHPSKARRFWRIAGECFQRAVTPFLMYFFMGVISLICMIVDSVVLQIVFSAICFVCGVLFNAHLLFMAGGKHYDGFATNSIKRRNKIFGIDTGVEIFTEKEYRFWKGFVIGLIVAIPGLFFGIFAIFFDWARIACMLTGSWGMIPVQWMLSATAPDVNGGFTMLFALIPAVVSGVGYILGAYYQKRKLEAQAARSEAVAELSKQAHEAQKERLEHEQTEAQKRKRTQSKKKK